MITIGINYTRYHDSSACITRDGEVLFALAEERATRIKHDARFPSRALSACFEVARVRPDEVHSVCFGSVDPGGAYSTDLKCLALRQLIPTSRDFLHSTSNLLAMWHERNGKKCYSEQFEDSRAKFLMVDHHLAHAISAYAYSGFSDSAVLVIDGRGAWRATSIWHGRDGQLSHELTIPWPNSLGLFYASMTSHLGFRPNMDEWKVMGLAPYGQPGIELSNLIIPESTPYWVNARELWKILRRRSVSAAKLLGPPREQREDLNERHKCIAFAVQDASETAIMNLARLAAERTHSRNLCLAGGVALNSKANGKLAASGLFDGVFVQPAPADDGVALGAALIPYLNRDGRLPLRQMRHTYLGRSFADKNIESLLNAYKLRYKRVNSPAETAAQLLAEGKILGWFQGRAEFGPRALGNRSILADPRIPDMAARLNTAVKFREWWRPFAPSILAESAASYVVGGTLPFMSITATVIPERRALIPAVTHVDGSTRPQTVEREINPLYWEVINEFRKRTDVPVLLNTSFNLQGEPIVNSPADALRTFFASGLDALVIGDFVVEK